jgi:hypothetical protein
MHTIMGDRPQQLQDKQPTHTKSRCLPPPADDSKSLLEADSPFLYQLQSWLQPHHGSRQPDMQERCCEG